LNNVTKATVELSNIISKDEPCSSQQLIDNQLNANVSSMETVNAENLPTNLKLMQANQHAFNTMWIILPIDNLRIPFLVDTGACVSLIKVNPKKNCSLFNK
jgi:hypothetical protein